MKRVILFAPFWTFLTKVFYFHIRDSFLGDIAEKWFRLLVFMLLFHGLFVCLSVCLSLLCTVLKWQKILTLFLLHTTVPCLSQVTLKFGLH